MTILYVYAHPSRESLNASMMAQGIHTLQNSGKIVLLSDLYAEQFSPTEWQNNDNLRAEFEKIARANHIIFQFPLWWFSMPAILKGWFDRVFIPGIAYEAGKTFAEGLLRGKTASLTVTTQSPESAYQLDGIHGAKLDAFLLPIHHTLRFAGIKPLTPHIVYGAVSLDENRHKKILQDYSDYLTSQAAAAS